MVTYTNNNYKNRLETRYTLEYIDNQKDMDFVCSGKISDKEPWERYKKKIYTDLDSAMSAYIIYHLNDNIYFCQLLEEIILEGETIRESYIEWDSSIDSTICKILQTDAEEEIKKVNNEIDVLEKSCYLMKQFCAQPYVKTEYDKFIKSKAQDGLTIYRYYSTLRPVSIGTYPRPEEATNIVNYDNRTFIDDIGQYAWGYIEYENPLEWSEAKQYDLEWNRYTKTEFTA